MFYVAEVDRHRTGVGLGRLCRNDGLRGLAILAGYPPTFIANYSLGTNAAWVMIGIMLWLATEWIAASAPDHLHLP